MSDYQAIYDAVRSRISGGNIGEAVADVARQCFDISHLSACVAQEFGIAAAELQRPFVLLKPRMSPDGNQWCALYGENLQEGVAGFGATPAQAAASFDAEWLTGQGRPHMTATTPAQRMDDLGAALRTIAHQLTECGHHAAASTCDAAAALLRQQEAEIARLRSDRDCEKRLRQDAEERREMLIEELAALRSQLVVDDEARETAQQLAMARGPELNAKDDEIAALRAQVAEHTTVWPEKMSRSADYMHSEYRAGWNQCLAACKQAAAAAPPAVQAAQVELVACLRCGHVNLIQDGRAPAQIRHPTQPAEGRQP